MANNTTLNSMTGGDVVSDDQITTLNGAGIATGEKVQRVKVAHGTAGTATDVTTTTPLPVTPIDPSATISIAANATSSGSLTGLNGVGTAIIQLTGTFVATVQVQIQVDGTNWTNITSSTAIINVATGAAVASGNLTTTGIYQLDIAGAAGVRVITTAYTSGTVTGTVKVTASTSLVSLDSPLPAGTAVIGALTANQAVNVAQINGVTPLMGSGVNGTGAQRVSLATDQAALSVAGVFSVKIDQTTPGTTNAVTDTKLPASAASADALTNPTITQIGADNMVFNGTTWDRQRSGVSVATTTGDTGAKTATGNGATQTNVGSKGIQIVIAMGAVTGTTPTCTLKVQGSVDGGTNWYDVPGATTAALTATGVWGISIYPGIAVTAGTTTTGTTATASGIIPRSWRMVWTIGGTTPSFTITSITYNYLT